MIPKKSNKPPWIPGGIDQKKPPDPIRLDLWDLMVIASTNSGQFWTLEWLICRKTSSYPSKKKACNSRQNFSPKTCFFLRVRWERSYYSSWRHFFKKNTRTWRDRTKKVRAHPTIRFTCRTLRFAKSHCMDGKNFSLKFAEGLGGENFKLSSQHPIIIAASVVSVENYGICLICLCCPWGCNGIHWT